MIKVKIYSKDECCLCDIAKDLIKKVNKNYEFEFIEVDITEDDKLVEKFKEEIPVIFINGRKAFKFRLTEESFIKRLKRV